MGRHRIAAAFIVLVACTERNSVPPRAPAVAAPTVAAPAVRLPLLPPSEVGPLVGAPGALEVEGPCLYLRTPRGTRTFVVFASPQTSWNDSARTLRIGQKTFELGDWVIFGGAPSDGLPSGVPWVQTPDPTCSTSDVFVVYSVAEADREAS